MGSISKTIRPGTFERPCIQVDVYGIECQYRERVLCVCVLEAALSARLGLIDGVRLVRYGRFIDN